MTTITETEFAALRNAGSIKDVNICNLSGSVLMTRYLGGDAIKNLADVIRVMLDTKAPEGRYGAIALVEEYRERIKKLGKTEFTYRDLYPELKNLRHSYLNETTKSLYVHMG